jgi:magnesium transporter
MSLKSERRRRRKAFARRTPPGTAPGTLAPDPDAPPTEVDVIAYGRDGFEEHKGPDLSRITLLRQKYPVVWVNVDGLRDVKFIEQLGNLFGLHSLAMEDVLHVHQRAKVEHYPDNLYVVARMLNPLAKLETEQLSVFLGDGWVITFQEVPGDCLDPVRDRLRSGRGRSRELGPDYLAYSILDAAIDAFFPLLEQIGEQLDVLEDQVLTNADLNANIADIHGIKNDLILIRRAIWPQREAINSLVRDPSSLVKDETRLFLRDCYDHTVQIIDLLEMYREVSSGLMDLYASAVSNRMNEVMKVLTIIATVFIPLTFIVGIYGMNFDPIDSPWNMPELHWYFGYPMVWVVMTLVTVSMVIFFRKQGWLASLVPRGTALKPRDTGRFSFRDRPPE